MRHEYASHRQQFEWRCIYRNCPADVLTFLSESDFHTHMARRHNIFLHEDPELLLLAKTCRRLVATINDANVNCPVCLRSMPNRKSKIGRHLGRHMEDIAIPILSLVLPATENGDSSGNSEEETTSEHELNNFDLPPLGSDNSADQSHFGDKPKTIPRTRRPSKSRRRRTRPFWGDTVLIESAVYDRWRGMER